MSNGDRHYTGTQHALQSAYGERLGARVVELRASCAALFDGDHAPGALAITERLARGLATSAARFGYEGIAEIAGDLASLVGSVLAAGEQLSDTQRAQLSSYLDPLELAARAPRARHRAQTGPTIIDATDVDRHEHHARLQPETRLICIVDGEPEAARELGDQLAYFGFEVDIHSCVEDLCDGVIDPLPAAIISEIPFDSGELAGARAIARLRQDGHQIPVLFLTSRQDLTARLEAARAGGDGFMTKPVDTVELIDVLDALTTVIPDDPYRVLVVEHSQPRAERCERALARAGMRTTLVATSMDIMGPLVNFRPDVILMQVDMPDYDGLELASALRQQEAYLCTPILFVTRDVRFGARLARRHLGGEPFLTEPFADDYLVSNISSLVERSRALQALMVRDSLTGLLNHSRIKEQLDYEIERARRDGTPLSYAMIDIDHFKLVNDRYGHPAGDRLLKSIARLLQRCLRKTDFIGRYGGDEFAVVLPGTSGSTAVKLLDAIRVTFAQIRAEWDAGGEPRGFSGGVSSFHDQHGADMNRDADRALYEAKHQGRNRVVLAHD